LVDDIEAAVPSWPDTPYQDGFLSTFVDPAKTNRVGLIVEIPDMDNFQQMMEPKEVADAMK
jgi:hypothetical protein